MSMETHPSSLQFPSSNSKEITQIQEHTDPINPPSQIHPKPKTSTMASNPTPQIPSSNSSQIAKTSSPESTHNDKTSAPRSLLKLVGSDLHYIQETCGKLDEYRGRVDEKLKNASTKFESLEKTFKSGCEDPSLADEGIDDEIRKFKKSVRKLKLPIPSKFKINYAELDKDPNLRSNAAAQGKLGDAMNSRMQRGNIPNLYKNSLFMHSVAFRDFDSGYQLLDLEEKLSLLCFSIFPQGAIIKKRLMVYRWIAEGFITKEELGCNFFNKFVDKAFIMPVNEKHRPLEEVGSCKMHPFVRSAVIMFAERAKFFDYDVNGNLTEDYTSSFRSCLTGKGLSNFDKLESLHMLFNVDEAILEFRLEWLMRMKNVNILYLGRWKASGKHHIEVEDTKFLQGLKYMKYLKFLSLQGISRITELPDSVSKLGSLTILDLRACHNLEVVPDDIGLLQNLRHLDMSECYLLEHMPKQLSLLKNLLVLKGFVVGDSTDKSACTLDALAKLPNLRKLSIYTAMKEFPTEKHLIAFPQFEKLSKLTIAWGGGTKSARAAAAKNQEPKAETKPTSSKNQEPKTETKPAAGKNQERNQEIGGKNKTHEANSTGEGNPNQEPGGNNTSNISVNKKLTRSSAMKPNREVLTGLPEKLEKLDLQCFSGKLAPKWLKPGNLKSLKKLYIRGGELHYLRRWRPEETWNVETLRLKYLSEFEMGWKELHSLFPELIYLEKVKCPKLTLFPCDAFGVWINKMKIKSR